MSTSDLFFAEETMDPEEGMLASLVSEDSATSSEQGRGVWLPSGIWGSNPASENGDDSVSQFQNNPVTDSPTLDVQVSNSNASDSPVLESEGEGHDFRERVLDSHHSDSQVSDGQHVDFHSSDSCHSDSQVSFGQLSDSHTSDSQYLDAQASCSHASESQILDNLKGEMVGKVQKPAPKWFRQARSEDVEEPCLSLPYREVGRPPDEPRRPKNAFMLFSAEQRMKLKEEGNTTDNRMVSRVLGSQWRLMSKEEKRPYQEEAARLYRQVKEEYPDWRYYPNQAPACPPEVVQASRLRPRDKVKWKLPPLLKRPYNRRDKTVSGKQSRVSPESGTTASSDVSECMTSASDSKEQTIEGQMPKESAWKTSTSGLGVELGDTFREKVAKWKFQEAEPEIEIDRDEVSAKEEEASSGLPQVGTVWSEVWRSETVNMDSAEVENLNSKAVDDVDMEEVGSDYEDDAYGCSLCGTWYKTSEALESHIHIHLTNKRVYKGKKQESEDNQRASDNKETPGIKDEFSSIEIDISGTTEESRLHEEAPSGIPESRECAMVSSTADAEEVGARRKTAAPRGNRRPRTKSRRGAALERGNLTGQGTAGQTPGGQPQWVLLPQEQLPCLVPLQDLHSIDSTVILVPVEFPHLTSVFAAPTVSPSSSW